MSSETGDYGGVTKSEGQKPDWNRFKNKFRLKNYRNGGILCEGKEKNKIIAKERCYIKVVWFYFCFYFGLFVYQIYKTVFS